MLQAVVVLYGRDELETIHSWHHDVTDDEVGQLLASHFESLLAISCREYMVFASEDPREQLKRLRLVVDDQDGMCGCRHFGRLCMVCCCRCNESRYGGGAFSYRQHERKGAAFAHRAFHCDVTVQQVSKLPDEIEAESVTLDIGGGGRAIALLEDVGQLIGRDADTSVAHAETHVSVIDVKSQNYAPAGWSVFKSIGDEVGQDEFQLLHIYLRGEFGK